MKHLLLRMSGDRIECVVVPENQVKLVKKLMKNKQKLADFAELANWKQVTAPPASAKTLAECTLDDEYYALVVEK
jgi:hypothetical protein